MRFIAGVVVTLVAISVAVFVVAYLGLYPIGADNAPTHLEVALAGRAMTFTRRSTNRRSKTPSHRPPII